MKEMKEMKGGKNRNISRLMQVICTKMVIFDNCYTVIIFERMNLKTTLVYMALAAVTGMLGIQAQTVQGYTHSGHPTGQPPFPLTSYVELANPQAVDADSWKGVTKPSCAWGSVYERYRKESHPKLHKKSLRLKGWKGERVSAQLVITSPEPLDSVQVEMSALQNRRHALLDDARVMRGFVRYVMTDGLNKDGKGTCGLRPDLSQFDSTLVADPIDPLTAQLSMQARTTQGYWVRVWIPQEAAAGLYTSELTVKNGSRVLGSLKLEVEVQRRTLPAPSHWAFHLDLWQNPFAVARYHRVPLWSRAHFDLLEKELQSYADAGGKVITTSIMHHPWGGQTYDPFESMITWMKRVDGTWYFDYTIFDKWVELMMKVGVTQEIGCYSMIPWKLSFQYFDQATHSLKEMKMKPEDPAYADFWLTMLKDFARHLKAKGWFDITHIAMDERPKKDMDRAFAIIHEADPDFKVSLAGALHEELSDQLDDYSIALADKFSEETKRARRAANKKTTFYTCCTESHPNTYTFSHPAEAAWIGWYAAKEHLDGYLRWALNSWTIEPLLDSRFLAWGAGDTYLVYPGARSSIRFENLVAGIQAYEKIRILKADWQKEGNKSALNRLDKILREFDEKQLDHQSARQVVEKADRFMNQF